MRDVTVVIGNYEGERLLPDCLRSITGQTVPVREVIVVDGASRDRSREVAGSLGATVVAEENGGLGYLYNRGAARANSEYVLLANNDVAFEPRCVELLADALDAGARRFAADPTQLDWNGQRVIHARASLRTGPLLRQPLPGFRLDLNVPADRLVHTLTANGGAMLVRRAQLLELGGFDETFFLEFEDLDLCWRAWLRGWESVYVPDARVRHRVGAATAPRDMTRRLASGHHNLVRFALKCLPARAAARVVTGELLRLPVHPRLVGGGLLALFRELSEIARLRRELSPSMELYRWIVSGQPGEPPASRASPDDVDVAAQRRPPA